MTVLPDAELAEDRTHLDKTTKRDGRTDRQTDLPCYYSGLQCRQTRCKNSLTFSISLKLPIVNWRVPMLSCLNSTVFVFWMFIRSRATLKCLHLLTLAVTRCYCLAVSSATVDTHVGLLQCHYILVPSLFRRTKWISLIIVGHRSLYQ